MNVLVFTTLWPNAEQPNFGVFVKNRLSAVAEWGGVKIQVIAPVPYFPRRLRQSFIPDHWRRLARVPERECIGGLETYHPRYLATPKIGMSFYARWLAGGTEHLARRLHREEPFDLIDAHYAYPDGAAAVMLGERLNIPVVITARGTDLNHFPELRLIRPQIQTALRKAAGVIAVSQSLKAYAVGLGIAPEKIAVIRNGVDSTIFFPHPRDEARRELRIDSEARTILSVGALIPRKGFDCLIEAARLSGEVQVYIIGEGPERSRLQAQIEAAGLSDRVFLVGSKLNSELAMWYSAADLFCLTSHREGYPNVVLESLACGTPVIASDESGVGELIDDPALVKIVAPPTPRNLASALKEGLAQCWDRDKIAEFGRRRSWPAVAGEVIDYWRTALD